jgi:protein involved in polysaccharide export with SLBB domain
VNLLLEDGDSVDVPLLPNRISVGGSVKMGGLLALERDLRVRKAIDIAGGAAPEADLTKVVIIHRDLSKTVVDVSTEDKITDPKQNPLLVDGDSVQVPALFKTGVVTVNGPGVSVPATVDLSAGMALDELVVNTGKPTTLANLEEVTLRRADKTVQTVNISPSSTENQRVLLQPGDTVYVREYNNRVLFLAPIPTAGQRALKPGQRLADFLRSQQDPGAFDASKVDLKNAQVVQSGAKKALKVNLVKVLSDPSDKGNVELTPGDVIVVPPKEPKGPKNEWMRNIPYLGTILTLLL